MDVSLLVLLGLPSSSNSDWSSLASVAVAMQIPSIVLLTLKYPYVGLIHHIIKLIVYPFSLAIVKNLNHLGLGSLFTLFKCRLDLVRKTDKIQCMSASY
jgi:hypothetical protein